MSTQAATMGKGNASSDHQVRSREEWLTARQDLVNRARELARLRDQLRAKHCVLACATIGKEYDIDGPTFTELSRKRNTFIKQSGYHLVGFMGPLIVAVYLLLQLHKLPNSSLGYSLLYAIISLLFNFSSSALLKAL